MAIGPCQGLLGRLGSPPSTLQSAGKGWTKAFGLKRLCCDTASQPLATMLPMTLTMSAKVSSTFVSLPTHMTKVRNTFLEFDEPEEEHQLAARRRCKSEPPAMRSEEVVHENGLFDEVASECSMSCQETLLIQPKDILGLDARAMPLLELAPNAAALSEASPAVQKLSLWPRKQPGSVGHPDICRRPCLFFNAGNCTNGEACDYCHLPHDIRPPHLDKRQRVLVGNLSEPQLLNLLLVYLEERAEIGGFLLEAEEVMQVLRQKAGVEPGAKPEMPRLPRQCQPKLRYMMQKMTFQALIGLALKSKYATEAFTEEVSGALARMRTTILTAAM